MPTLRTIDTSVLSTVTGGADETRLNFSFGVTGVSAEVSKTPEEQDKQLRCYKQVAGQSGWIQRPGTTVNQQIKLCGTLR
jgi:hypothetical protein